MNDSRGMELGMGVGVWDIFLILKFKFSTVGYCSIHTGSANILKYNLTVNAI